MAKPFDRLREKMTPEAREKAEGLADELRKEMRLAELRNVLGISQDELGQLLKRKQAAISRLERRSDMHVSTLREFIKALGGRLELVANFPEGSYRIKQFEQE